MRVIKEQLKWLERIVYFDQKDFLREKVSDHELLNKIIRLLEEKLSNTDNEDDKYFLTGMLGNMYRVNEQPEQAIEYLQESLEIAKQSNQLSREIVTKIRIGEAYKYAGKHSKALDLFDDALQKSYAYEPSYLDFAYQHKGKCLMELSQLDEALQSFRKALVIRKAKGDEKLVESTEQAINYAKKLMSK